MFTRSNRLTFIFCFVFITGTGTKVAAVRPSDGKEENIHLTAGFLGDELYVPAAG